MINVSFSSSQSITHEFSFSSGLKGEEKLIPLPFILSVHEKVTSIRPHVKIFTHSPLRLITNRTHCSLFRAAHIFVFEKKGLEAADDQQKLSSWHGSCSWTATDVARILSWWAFHVVIHHTSFLCINSMFCNYRIQDCQWQTF